MGLLISLAQLNEFVVADGPTRHDPSSQTVLNISDSTLLVLQLSDFLGQFFGALTRLLRHLNGGLALVGVAVANLAFSGCHSGNRR